MAEVPAQQVVFDAYALLLRNTVGQPGWGTVLRGLMIPYLSSNADFTEEQWDLTTQLWEIAREADPDAFDAIAAELGFNYGDASADPQDAFLEALQNMLGADASARIENVRRDIAIDTERSQRTDITTRRTIREFVDVPTAEEFLNDFDVGMATHVQSLLGAGEIDQATADFISQNQDFFLQRYIQMLSAMIARGEDIYKIVGAGGDITRVGTRPGAAEDTTVAGTTETDETTTVTEEAVGTTVGGEEQRTTEETETAKTIREQFESQTRLRETEEIFRRQNLTSVFRVSPLQFLSQFGAKDLNELFQGTKGTRQRAAQTATGPPSFAPRRVSF